ncbi:MAG: galactose-1-phosphate uridylyltransferase [Acidobacteria bacterium]|nr:galactose-1-phosphate uridylyltransferase [Acidobacteriota bacterium]MBI3278373.1 galactose-1-phosphate uridylyltransferase [Acidobacteriota bacterium]
MPELRKDPITGRWVIIATERAKRPSDFAREAVVSRNGHFCPFCPGNELKTPPEILAYRNGGGANQPGWQVRVVPNKFPALRVEGELSREGAGMYDRISGVGAHEVLIETPEHGQTLSTMDEKRVADLFWAFRDRVLDLKKDVRLRYILLFKNHGEAAGASLEHPHSQLIALPVVPKRVQEELEGSRRHWKHKERCIYCDILHEEIHDHSRVILESDHFLVIAPYAARFPFECWILPKLHHSHVESISPPAIQNLGGVLQKTLRKLDRTLELPPYNFIVHTAPVQEPAMPYYHWHIEVIPKLTRVAGFEWGSGFHINPTPPEEAAMYLREGTP